MTNLALIAPRIVYNIALVERVVTITGVPLSDRPPVGLMSMSNPDSPIKTQFSRRFISILLISSQAKYSILAIL
jgi:hypothetical protein